MEKENVEDLYFIYDPETDRQIRVSKEYYEHRKNLIDQFHEKFDKRFPTKGWVCCILNSSR